MTPIEQLTVAIGQVLTGTWQRADTNNEDGVGALEAILLAAGAALLAGLVITLIQGAINSVDVPTDTGV